MQYILHLDILLSDVFKFINKTFIGDFVFYDCLYAKIPSKLRLLQCFYYIVLFLIVCVKKFNACLNIYVFRLNPIS